MKKWLFVFIVLILSVCIAAYAFIPGVIKLSKTERVAANSEEAFKYFANDSLRLKWISTLPGYVNAAADKIADNFFILREDSFILFNANAPSANILIANKKEKLNSVILFISKGGDSTIILWESEIITGTNPIKRISNYFAANKISSHFNEILNTYKSFISVPQNIYSFPIETTKVKDTILIASRKVFPAHPTVEQIYVLVNKLENYALVNDARPTNAPMLNITLLDSSHYQCTIALPIDKKLKNTSEIYFSRMVPGRILVQTVAGGPATIKYAYGRLLDYFRQHKHVSPALSFESMVTNRIKEADTSKWVTKIYYPIF